MSSRSARSSVLAALALLLSVAAALAYPAPATADPAGPIQWRSTTDVIQADAAWTRLLRLQDGDWLAVYTIYPPDLPSQLQIARSTDNARTWTVISTVVDPGRKLDTGVLFQLPNGNVLLTARSLIDGQSYRLPVWQSTNNGVTWGSYLSVVDANENAGGATNHGLWEPYLFLLPDGRLSILYADETVSGYSQVISQRVSSDGGATWSAKTTAVYSSANPATDRPGMPAITRMANGQYLLAFEVCSPSDSQCQISEKTSADGTTWDTTLGSQVPNQACGPFLASLADGRVVITSCSNQVSYSSDYGQTWQLVNPSPFGYGFAHTWPAIYQTGANEIATVVSVPQSFGEQKIRFASLSAFWDTFDGGTDTNWTRYGGTFQLTGGAYQLDNAPGAGNTTGKAVAGDSTWTNGAVEADLTITSPTGDAGVMSRVTSPGPGVDDAYGYYAYLDPAAGVGLGKEAYNWTPITTARMTVTPGTVYRLRLVTIGTTIQVYVNGTLEITASDSSFTQGQIGVRSHYANATFDNVVYTPTTSRDNFSSGDDGGWTRYGGNPSVASGTYNLSNASTTGKSAWSVVGPHSDITFETDVNIASGGGDAGAVFRATNLGTGADAMNGYYAGLNPTSNAIVLGKMNGSWSLIASTPFQVGTNTWHHLKVTDSGIEIRVYVDDMNTPKLDVNDPTWTTGDVGVRAHYTNASFRNTSFDDAHAVFDG